MSMLNVVAPTAPVQALAQNPALAGSLAFVLIIFFVGLYTLLTNRNLIKIIIGIEILAKAVTLNLIWAGHFQNRIALGEALTILVIAIDAVVLAILMSLAVASHKHYGTVDVDAMTRLKG